MREVTHIYKRNIGTELDVLCDWFNERNYFKVKPWRPKVNHTMAFRLT